MSKIVVTGISGQDGSYLTELLLEEGHQVYGLVRRNSVVENQQSRLDKILSHVDTRYGDILDTGSIEKLIREVQPEEVYNLASQSHVRISYEIPQYTCLVNSIGALNVLEAVRQHSPHSRFYQASSSEMFGNSVDADGFQRESTPMKPVSPYGCAKLFAYSLARNYRHAYGMFASNGILFNHESPRRASNFVTGKVVKNALLIKKGLVKKLELGNLDSFRDWGHSKDYVKAMTLIVRHHAPDDFVVATGESHSIRKLCEVVFSKLGLDYSDYVVQNEKFMRPEELEFLCGDSTKARRTLGWTPRYTFEKLIEDMLENFHDPAASYR
jgi:GDPmannose 4,6-dehydratase